MSTVHSGFLGFLEPYVLEVGVIFFTFFFKDDPGDCNKLQDI